MKFDVIVIGGGHAGCEAAHAAAKILQLKSPRRNSASGSVHDSPRVALLSLRQDRVGFLSCNPAMGGLAKGQLVKEIDALGGIMGRITDRAAIQYKKLNASKGPAVRSSRAQCDKAKYAAEMQAFLLKQSGLTLLPAEATDIKVKNGRVIGVVLDSGQTVECGAVVVTTGTFLRAIMHTGEIQEKGGRVGDKAAFSLGNAIENLGFPMRRLKTGTPPRLAKETINFSVLEEQDGDLIPSPFSFFHEGDFPILPQVKCHITYTNQKTHEIIEKAFDRSPMFTGVIKGVGPRYCPSIEDKVKRFKDKDRHQIFLEPEGLETNEIYVNGVSTSLPMDIQKEFINSINGLESAQFLKYGYAVEYDAVNATSLKRTMEAKDIQGLFFAGQINGTSGYEEAGAQGILAGINAAQQIIGGPEFVLARDQAYIGVLIDDLCLYDMDEPYRMFTSRAEHRLILREDNADQRLTPLGRRVGLISDEQMVIFEEKQAEVGEWEKRAKNHFFLPTTDFNAKLQEKAIRPIKDRFSAVEFLKRPEVDWNTLIELGFNGVGASSVVREQIEINVKYAGYIERDKLLQSGIKESDGYRLPRDFDFGAVPGLSTEVIQRLERVRPETLGQCGRIGGVTPAAVANILIYLKMKAAKRGSAKAERIAGPQ